jgi:hypothetical protein
MQVTECSAELYGLASYFRKVCSHRNGFYFVFVSRHPNVASYQQGIPYPQTEDGVNNLTYGG